MNILDVWFESGSSWNAVMRERSKGEDFPVDLYLEGSDQHRGWFHSSLLESCGTKGHAPYKNVLTHGFVLDDKGYKMSKSLGNVVSPQDVMKNYGADILRLWVVGSNYAADLSVGPNIIKQMSDLYRRLRNTLRYLLGNLAGFDPSAAEVPPHRRVRVVTDASAAPSPSTSPLPAIVAMASVDRARSYTATLSNRRNAFCALSKAPMNVRPSVPPASALDHWADTEARATTDPSTNRT